MQDIRIMLCSFSAACSCCKCCHGDLCYYMQTSSAPSAGTSVACSSAGIDPNDLNSDNEFTVTYISVCVAVNNSWTGLDRILE